ncbi:hypothetical protein C8A05DRAFT_17388 [Staphylotrichum tortipilum]|uniref:Uncharacterized protein n=1 Tax=Staphylotrichum tortipilum TaxID=2831512 RepID=A0AAN6RRN0_9PEZI|nr:hypothetical protein C8A05DRAFT_17388 [Staphylotrichum longicolle]
MPRLFSPATSSIPAATNNNGDEPDGNISWESSALTLRNLHGLASSLRKDDEVELAPVQAWFELVRRFGVGEVMREGVLERLKRELGGGVRCPHFGAALGRGVFEGVVGGRG